MSVGVARSVGGLDLMWRIITWFVRFTFALCARCLCSSSKPRMCFGRRILQVVLVRAPARWLTQKKLKTQNSRRGAYPNPGETMTFNDD
ncbi:hypothetical protein F5146DRAFT_447794 [Armillaria mellea]|nr:hypothetical protein F5146DRAFT_447794 [Armillaria mellea]